MLKKQFLPPRYKLPITWQGESQALVLHSPHSCKGMGLFKGKNEAFIGLNWRLHTGVFSELGWLRHGILACSLWAELH